jgi:predicted nucleic acid-binding protein
MPDNETLVYWDSCVFIDRIEAKNSDRIDTLRAMTDAAERGELMIVTSALAMAEVVKLTALSEASDKEKENLIVEFFDNEYISVRNVTPAVSERARHIIRDHNLKPPDAIHVATALLTKGVRVLETYDESHLIPLDGKIGNPPLCIRTPKWVWQQSLETTQPQQATTPTPIAISQPATIEPAIEAEEEAEAEDPPVPGPTAKEKSVEGAEAGEPLP